MRVEVYGCTWDGKKDLLTVKELFSFVRIFIRVIKQAKDATRSFSQFRKRIFSVRSLRSSISRVDLGREKRIILRRSA